MVSGIRYTKRVDSRFALHRFGDHKQRINIAILIEIYPIIHFRVIHDFLAQFLDNLLLKLLGLGFLRRRNFPKDLLEHIREDCRIKLVGQVNLRRDLRSANADWNVL
jgi:hypothetical protein